MTTQVRKEDRLALFNVGEVEALRDFARNVAGLDDRLLNNPAILKQWRDDARKMPQYPHMCSDGHQEIGHSDPKGDELCPLCRAMATLQEIADKEGEDLSGNDAEHMVWAAKRALAAVA